MSGRSMHRRGAAAQLARVLAFTILLGPAFGLTGIAMSAEPNTPSVLVPVEKPVTAEARAALYARGAQHVYRGKERATIGMPCGGIAAGQVYVLGDGTLGSFLLDGAVHFSGYGADNYRTYQPPRPIAQGFALATKVGSAAPVAATLDEEGYDAIEFVGEYPRAVIRYRAKDKAVPPVEVDVEVFSPLVPLDARNSAWPATVLRFTLRNPGKEAVEVALGGWLQNYTFPEVTTPIVLQRRNRVTGGGGLTGVAMEAFAPPVEPAVGGPRQLVLADFESGDYAGWTVTGTACGTRPAKGTLPEQQKVSGFGGQYLVNTFVGGDDAKGKMTSEPFVIALPYLTFRIGGGAQAEKACLNLVVDGKVERTVTGKNSEKLEPGIWDVRALAGKTARLEIVDEQAGPWGHINVDDLVLTNVLPEEYQEYDPNGLGAGTMALSLVGDGVAEANWAGKDAFVAGLKDALGNTGATETDARESSGAGPQVGTVTTRCTLEPGATRDVSFIVSWHFPNLSTKNGRMYANWYADATDVAAKLVPELERLRAETVRFCDVYYRGATLPWWLNARLMMPTANLATGTAQWWKNGRFWAWEGVGCCEGTCTHVWNYAQTMAYLFPELERSARSMQDLGAGFHETSGLVGFRSDANFAADGQAGTILKCYREHLASPDGEFLRKHWSRIQIALDYLISHDLDEDGLIESDRQHNTYDINFVGPNTFVGALYLAALRAGEEMARQMGDEEAAQRYRAIFTQGSAWTARHLFNGEYFEQRIPPGDERPYQYGKGCLSDQVFGQNWAHQLGLGYVYPPEQVRSALAAVFKYCWAPDVGTLNGPFPPERWFARAGEPGLFICTWPKGGRSKEPVRYRDEVWTGIEYQVAAGLAWEGLADASLTEAALRIVDGIERRYDGTRHNPWNEVECGDHYARALASWGVLHALAGFRYDGPAGKLALAPRMQAEDFACFYSSGTAWGRLVQQRPKGGGQVNRIEVHGGQLRVTSLAIEVPPGVAELERVAIEPLGSGTADGQGAPAAGAAREIKGARLVCAGTTCQVEFAEAVVVEGGERLVVRVR